MTQTTGAAVPQQSARATGWARRGRCLGASDHAHWGISSSRRGPRPRTQAAVVLPKAWLWGQPSQRGWAGFSVDGGREPGPRGKVGPSESVRSDGGLSEAHIWCW